MLERGKHIGHLRQIWCRFQSNISKLTISISDGHLRQNNAPQQESIHYKQMHPIYSMIHWTKPKALGFRKVLCPRSWSWKSSTRLELSGHGHLASQEKSMVRSYLECTIRMDASAGHYCNQINAGIFAWTGLETRQTAPYSRSTAAAGKSRLLKQ